MKRPSFFIYLVGNPLSFFVLLGFSGWLVYQWWIGQAGALALLIAVVALGIAMDASQKIADYSSWKRSWNAMGGVSYAARFAWLRMPLAIATWLGGAYGVSLLNSRLPWTKFAVTSYAAGSALIVVVLLCRLVRRWLARRPRRFKEVIVTISLRVPRTSPGRRQFSRGLPVYCARLARR